MIPYGHQSVDEEDIRAVADALRSDWLTQGTRVDVFEQALAEYCGARFAIVFSNGTAALQAAYFAMGFQPGDEFITTPLTFAATSNAGLWQGGKPVFADVDPATGNLDPAEIERHITERTKAIVPVDYAGVPVDIAAIRAVAKKHDLLVLEDGCHALGASVVGRKVGSLSDLTAFSFHPVKPITTGEGGAVATDSEVFAERMRVFRTHGITKKNLERPNEGAWYGEMQELGLNYRLTDFQCALGISQLKKLDGFIEIRNRIADRYLALLKDVDGIRLPSVPEDARAGWHLFPIRIQGKYAGKRREIFDALRAAGIGVQVHYLPVYLHPYYARLGYARGSCPQAEAYYEAEISLPIFPSLTEQDQQTVIDVLKKLLS